VHESIEFMGQRCHAHSSKKFLKLKKSKTVLLALIHLKVLYINVIKAAVTVLLILGNILIFIYVYIHLGKYTGV
jgi:hypothetical protein